MADQVTILELLVDAGPALDTLEKLVPALERVAEAAQQTASAVDRVSVPMTSAADSGERLSTGATAAAAGVNKLSAEAARAEQNLIRQSAAVDGNVGVTLKLTQQLANLSAAQAEANQRMQQFGAGSIGKVAGEAELAALAERTRQTEAALALLGSSTASVAEVMQRFPAAFTSTTNSAGQLIAQLDRLIAKYDPAAAAVSRMSTELDVLSRAQKAGLDTGNLQADKIAAAYDLQAQAAEKAAVAAKKLADTQAAAENRQLDLQAQAAEKAAAAAKKLADAQAAAENRQLDAAGSKLREEYDAQSVAIERYEARLAQLDKLVATNRTTEATATAEKEKAVQALSAQINALGAHSAATAHNTETVKGSAAEHLKLGAEGEHASAGIEKLEEVVKTLTNSAALGIPILTALQLEATGIAATLAGWAGIVFSPAVLGIAGLATVIELAGERAGESQKLLREFGVITATLGTESQATSEDLKKTFETIRDSGVGSEKALQIVKELALSPVINKDAIPLVASLGERLSALNTGGLSETVAQTQRVKAALEGGAESTIKLATSVGALTGEEAGGLLVMARHVSAVDAMNAAITAMDEHIKPVSESLGQLGKTNITLLQTWEHLRDVLGDSTLGQGAIGAFKLMLVGIEELVKGIDLLITKLADITLPAPLQAIVDLLGKLAIIGAVKGLEDRGGVPTDATAARIANGNTAPIPGPEVFGPPAPTSNTIQAGLDFFTARGLTLEQASGVVGRLAAESGGGTSLNPLAVNQDSGAYGIAQWLGSRLPAALATGGDLNQQLELVWKEFQTAESSAFKRILNTNTAEDAAVAMERFERARDPAFTAKAAGVAKTIFNAASEEGSADFSSANLVGTPAATGATPQAIAAMDLVIKEQTEKLELARQAWQGFGVEQQKVMATQSADALAQEKGLDAPHKLALEKLFLLGVEEKSAVQTERNAQFEAAHAQGLQNEADGYRVSEQAGLQATAMMTAQNETLQRNSNNLRTFASNRNAAFLQSGDVSERATQLLIKEAATAESAAQKRVASMDPVIAAEQRMADASAQGAQAAANEAIHNQAVSQTENALTSAKAAHNQAELTLAKAQAEGNEKLIALASSQVAYTGQLVSDTAATEANTEAKLRHLAALKNIESLNTASTKIQDTAQATQLEIDLQGKTTEFIRTQVDLLKAKQTIDEHHVNDLGPKDAAQQKTAEENYLAQVAAAGALKDKFEEAQRAQQRLNDLVRGVADTIASQLGTALDNAFSGKKAQDWGETMKQILRDLLKQIVEFTLIRPAIGSALGALEFAQVAQQFGSFGSLGGGSAIDPVSGLTTATTNGTGGGIGSLLGGGGSPIGTGLSAISGLGKLQSLFGGDGALSGVGNFVSGIFGGGGASLAGDAGLAATLNAADATAALAGTESASALSASGVSSALSGGVLGSLGSVLSIAAPIAGVAGLVLGLTGILGNKKPSLASSGDVIDLATGTASGFASSGNAQNDASVKSITGTIQQFLQTVTKETGGTAPTGALNVVQTLKGVEVNYAGELGNVHEKFADAQSAITAVETVLAQNIRNISDTMRQVLSTITDPSQVQAAVTFATTYDNLKKAADSAFSSISDDTFKIGPFATAFANLTKQFGDLATQASQFGLALDPINAGLAEATKRLQTDFGTSLDTALNTANANDFVNTLKTVSATFATNTQEAQAIGLGSDQDTAAKIALLETTQAAAALAPLTADQLQTVVTQLGKTNPEIAGMAQAILNAGLAATGATTSLGNLASGIKSVEDLATSLRTGQLSGLPPAQAAAAAGGSFATQLGATLAAGKGVTSDQLTQLSSLGTAAIQASQAAYGEGPQTAALRTSILGGLGQVTAITGPSTAAAAAAAAASSPATAIQAALGASPAVQAAQVAAVMAALRVAGVPGYAGGTNYTAPGAILVGEAGPEVISQAGGLSVTPISAHPGWSWRGSSGTGDGVIAERMNALIAEVAALRRQTQGGQVQQMSDMAQQTGYLGQINRKAGPGVVQPKRQSAGR